MSAAFALAADITMLALGGALKRKEALSGRLAEALSHLYLASAVLKRFEDQGRPAADLPLAQWACEDALATIQDQLDGLLTNFPNRAVARLLRVLVFPWGRRERRPDDALTHQVANLLLEPSAARDRLTTGIYMMPTDASEMVGRLDVALETIVAADAVERRLRAAVQAGRLQPSDESRLLDDAVEEGVLNKQEADLIRDATTARRDVITVDDFPPPSHTPSP